MTEYTIEELRKLYESSPFNNYLGIKLESFEKGAVCYSLKVNESHKNVNAAIHGGVYFSILDSVMGATIRSAANKPVITINTTINFLAPLTDGDQMIASGKIIQQGKSIIIAEGEVKDRNGKLLAKTVGTFKFINLGKNKK